MRVQAGRLTPPRFTTKEKKEIKSILYFVANRMAISTLNYCGMNAAQVADAILHGSNLGTDRTKIVEELFSDLMKKLDNPRERRKAGESEK